MTALEKKYQDQVEFVIVDVQEPQGQNMASLPLFNIYYIPALFMLDSQGQVVYSETGAKPQGELEAVINQTLPSK